jgi:tetratricopeptide (TPR) repeat protein
MDRQRLATVVAVLASVLATGMSIEPKRVAAPVAVKLPDAPAAGAAADPATAQPLLPPDGYLKYLSAVLTAEALQDPLARCLAYPALPGNEWLKGLVEALCALVPPEGSLDAWQAALKQPGGGAELDRRFAALNDAHYNDPNQKDRIFRAYDNFDASDQAAAVAEEWVRQSPESIHAHTARAWQLIRSGWQARGPKLMRQTPGENVRRMEEAFARAISDVAFAVKQDPKYLPACDRLLTIGANGNDALQQLGSNLCFSADPSSYRVMRSLLWAAQPKWGGSLEEMRALVAIAREQEAKNPALAEFRGAQAGYESAEDFSDNHFVRTGPALERISRLSPVRLQDTSRALINLDRAWDAIVYASQAIRFHPDDGKAYYDRANALRKLNAYELAIEDARRAKALEKIPDGWADLELTISLYALGRHKEAREEALEAMSYPATRGDANRFLCSTYLYTHQLDEMAECTEKFIVDFPGDDEAWRLRAVAYKDAGNPKMYDAVDDFLQRADPKGQAAGIKWFKAWQLEHPRPQAAAGVPAPLPSPDPGS